jgi:YD repeat-containing protein
MRTAHAIFLVLAAIGCSGGDEHRVPSARLTPHLDAAPTWRACASEVRYGSANTPPDLTYAYTYDGAGRLAHVDGIVVATSMPITMDYTWTEDGQLSHKVYQGGDSNSETIAHYDPTDGLLDYTWDATASSTPRLFGVVRSSFTGPDEPAQEVITQQDSGTTVVTHDQLTYDADGRLALDTPDVGSATSYTYDDQARTVTANTGSGAWVDVTAYDASARELSETWSSNDASILPGSLVSQWSGDQLLTQTWSSGQPSQVDEIDTYRYDCP